MKNVTSLSKVAIATLLAVGGVTTINHLNNSDKTGVVQAATVINSQSNQSNQSAQPVHSTHVSQAVNQNVQTNITLPAGYTQQRVLDANNNRLSNADKQALVESSRQGMEQNKFYDNNPQDKQTMVDTTNMNHDQKVNISNYAVNVINSARRQMGKQDWKLNDSAISFADRVATEYTNNDKSDWDADHYVAGITRAAVASGLKDAGQVYEDEAGLPITSQYDSSIRSMYSLKEQVYFNIKQMLFGGYYGSMSNFSDTSHYTEWGHAGDLLGLRSLRGTDAPTKYFGLSFSGLKSDPRKISVHFISVADRYIVDHNKFITGNTSKAQVTKPLANKSNNNPAPKTNNKPSYKNQWVSENGSTYYYDKNGKKIVNQWYTFSNGTYYVSNNGHTVKNQWFTMPTGKTYYFTNDGHTVKNQWYTMPGGKTYYFTNNGHTVKNQWYTLPSGQTYYFTNDGHTVKNRWFTMPTGKTYYFTNNGHTVKNQWYTLPSGQTYYFDNNGHTVRNRNYTLNGVTYYFDNNGHTHVINKNEKSAKN